MIEIFLNANARMVRMVHTMVADLTIDFAPSYEVEQRVQVEIDRLQQLSVVVHVVDGHPNRSDIHHLLQA